MGMVTLNATGSPTEIELSGSYLTSDKPKILLFFFCELWVWVKLPEDFDYSTPISCPFPPFSTVLQIQPFFSGFRYAVLDFQS